MTPSDIGKAYDQITQLWASEQFNMSNGIEPHKRAIAVIDKQYRGAALDIGCGCTGRFFDLLLSEGFEPEGIDVSAEMVRLAQLKHPHVPVHQQNICDWVLPKRYDLITAWDSIWHIPLASQELVISKIVDALNPCGVFVFSFGGTTEPGDHCDSFMGPEIYYSSLGTNGFLSLVIKLGCQCIHLEYDQPPSPHAFMIVRKGAA
ncbi:class I SAM-dependent methyltransferase [Halopseudomonas nanhaiensis]|uniref:class I SAM-dependent DNA methyltransferase n=1 Tax=Halopseudomonas nanhaiensis TaxID=2830842 RepID=UPI001CC1B246|nr:class I SAM-dependent methyltransferase [Halopseudomonas nanhaiensis]UAW99600.1 class I SAM-dependent methyltransferase [Halopseudomonas nanhaiensis]